VSERRALAAIRACPLEEPLPETICDRRRAGATAVKPFSHLQSSAKMAQKAFLLARRVQYKSYSCFLGTILANTSDRIRIERISKDKEKLIYQAIGFTFLPHQDCEFLIFLD
jgi:hypothetical protein